MDYTLLTDTQRQQIALRKLLDLEAEHAGMELDIRLALSTGVVNDNVTNAQQQFVLLGRQIELLRSWVLPPQTDEDSVVPDHDDLISPNGLDPVEVE